MRKLWSVLVITAILAAAIGTMNVFADEKKPSVIRIGSGGGSGLGKPYVSMTMGLIQQLGLIEEEFKKDNIKIEWNFYTGAGFAQNEAFANDTLDVGYQSNNSFIIGRANGLKIKALAATCRQNNYIAVSADSPISTFLDLKGKKVGVQIGSWAYLFFLKALDKNGLTVKDVNVYNLAGADANAALLAGQIDATIGTTAVLDLRQRGLVKIIYSAKEGPASWLNVGMLVIPEKFIKAYPDTVRRIVKVWVKAAQWGSEEKNRERLFSLWSNGGTSVASFKEEYEGRDGKWINSPLNDDFLVAHTNQDIALFKEKKVIRRLFDENEWLDSSFLDQVLKDQGLEHYWTALDKDGNEVKK